MACAYVQWFSKGLSFGEKTIYRQKTSRKPKSKPVFITV